MRKAEIKGYESRLVEMSERLRGTVEELDKEIVEERTSQGDLAHFGTHNADHDTEFLEADEVAERNEVALLNEVEAALARIGKGTYGLCEACGKEIPRKRLDAAPYVARCSACT
jgi:RNA polymerase-binding protein DksA